MLDLGLSPAEALAQPRIHHQWAPHELSIEESLPQPMAEALRARGHKVKVVTATGVSQIVARNKKGVDFLGAADPRAGGTSAGW